MRPAHGGDSGVKRPDVAARNRAAGNVPGAGAALRGAFAERVRQYADLRHKGATAIEAAGLLGVHWDRTGSKYERWYQAAERGEIELPGTGGAA